ncbi:hypothetical protein F4777DRAFT_120686 [Nemania sp. FL0916]|nr:hypothetical protein F4777DRAFT_120686 [Nemania sp. FL0916]
MSPVEPSHDLSSDWYQDEPAISPLDLGMTEDTAPADWTDMYYRPSRRVDDVRVHPFRHPIDVPVPVSDERASTNKNQQVPTPPPTLRSESPCAEPPLLGDATPSFHASQAQTKLPRVAEKSPLGRLPGAAQIMAGCPQCISASPSKPTISSTRPLGTSSSAPGRGPVGSASGDYGIYAPRPFPTSQVRLSAGGKRGAVDWPTAAKRGKRNADRLFLEQEKSYFSQR